jgi:hypothetical protein
MSFELRVVSCEFSHRSLLITHGSKASAKKQNVPTLPIPVFQTDLDCTHFKAGGLKAPGYLYSRLSDGTQVSSEL